MELSDVCAAGTPCRCLRPDLLLRPRLAEPQVDRRAIEVVEDRGARRALDGDLLPRLRHRAALSTSAISHDSRIGTVTPIPGEHRGTGSRAAMRCSGVRPA